MEKIFIGVDSNQLDSTPDLEPAHAGLAKLHCSHASEDIEKIRGWARARLSRGGKKRTILIFQSVESIAKGLPFSE